MVMKKREVEVQKNHTERLTIAVEKAKESKNKTNDNLLVFQSFVNESIDILDSFEKELKEKIIDFSSTQREEYLKDVSGRMKTREVDNHNFSIN